MPASLLPSRLAALATILALFSGLMVSCGRHEVTPTRALKVAFFQDLSVNDAIELVSPAFFGLQIAFSEGGQALEAGLQLDQYDTAGDEARAIELARGVAADPDYVAVVIAPFWSEPASVAAVFAAAGMPVLGLSPEGGPPGPVAGWRRLVPDGSAQANALAGALDAAGAAGGLCIGSDATPYAVTLSTEVRAALRAPISASFGLADLPDAAVQIVRTARCSAVGWIGFPSGASALRDALDASGLGGVRLIGADAMKTISYIQKPGRDGTIVTCPCVDVTTDPRLAAQQLVHDYQAATGLEPGAYAAEAWDGGQMLVAVVGAGAVTRAELLTAIESTTAYEGVARGYRWTDGLLSPDAAVSVYHSEGVRWLAVGGPAETACVALP